MPLCWRLDPVALLKEKGYSSYRIRKENIFSQSTLSNMRHRLPISWNDLELLCKLTGKNVGKLIEYVERLDD